MKSKISRKVFPFAPGIAWKIQNGKYVIPEIERGTWSSALDGRDLVVLAHGGLLETFFSLTIVEALGRMEPSKELFWAGKTAFKGVIESHGQAKFVEVPDIGSKYPVPLFMDNERRAFFNALNNYRVEKSYFGSHHRKNTSPVCKQIFQNSLLPWDKKYVPKLRTGGLAFDAWAKMAKFHLNKKYVLVIPGQTGCSQYNTNCLGWGGRELKEFAAMLRRFDVDVVLCIGGQTAVYDAPYIQAPRTMGVILSLLPKASMILSSDIDFILIGLALSRAAIVAPQNCSKDEFDLYANAEFLGSENVIFTTDTPTPGEIYTMCEGIL